MRAAPHCVGKVLALVEDALAADVEQVQLDLDRSLRDLHRRHAELDARGLGRAGQGAQVRARRPRHANARTMR